MILTYLQHPETADALIKTAAHLAQHLKKQLGFVSFVSSATLIEERKDALKHILSFADVQLFVVEGGISDLAEFCETQEAAFLLLQLTDESSKAIQTMLTACRGLRIPYLLYKSSFAELRLEKVLVPVGFLEEEIEKAQFASAFGRFYGSEITLLQANDYGSKAAATTERMKTLFDKFQLTYFHEKAKSDSFKLEQEAIRKAQNENFGIVIISASREYGLDDIIFGPKERKIVKQSTIPVLLVNPRGDLYAQIGRAHV